MKKLLLAMAIASVATGAQAQLPVGSVAPDFTLKDINGVTHHLYNYLDSGYAVIIDVSAAWCGPCWSAHQSGVFDNLVSHYGANGTITPGKVKVIFIEGEPTNTTAQLYGTSTGSTHADYSQGDWVTGSNYPFIDTTALNSTYLYGGFPSFTVICRDRLVAMSTAGYGSAMGQESWWLNYINAECPSYAPPTGTDVKAVNYYGSNTFLCSANPTLKFLNYSQNTLTSATVKMYSGASLVGTQNWTGSLPTYGVGSVTMPAFTPTGSQTIDSFTVTATGDINLANNSRSVSGVSIITQTSSSTVPVSQDFESTSAMPAKYVVDDADGFFWADGTGSTTITGTNGQGTKCVVADFYDLGPGTTSEILLGNYDNASVANSSFEWDMAHAQYVTSGTGSADKLELFVSKDCGATWTSLWSKQGATLSTHSAVGSGQFIPASSSDWRHEGVSLNNYKSNNLYIKFKLTSDYGNFGFLDNFKITNTTDIKDIVANNSVTVYPNPAKDAATLSIELLKSSDVSVQIYDMVGRLVVDGGSQTLASGKHNIQLSVANLPAGLYNVKIQTEAGNLTERLTIAK